MLKFYLFHLIFRDSLEQGFYEEKLISKGDGKTVNCQLDELFLDQDVWQIDGCTYRECRKGLKIFNSAI